MSERNRDPRLARRGWTVVLLCLAATLGIASPALAAASGVQAAPGTYFLNGVACVSRAECIAVGQGAQGSFYGGSVVRIDHGKPQAQQLAGQTDTLNSIACWDPQHCVAVGNDHYSLNMVVVTITNGVPGAPMNIAGTGLYDVSCEAGSSMCVAVGIGQGGGVVIPIDGGAPGTPSYPANTGEIFAVSCVGSHCMAGTDTTGAAALLSIDGSTAGSVEPLSWPGEVTGVSCVSTSYCEAVGTDTSSGSEQQVALTIGHGHARRPVNLDGFEAAERVTCTSPARCVAVGRSYVSSTDFPGAVDEIVNGQPQATQSIPAMDHGFTYAGATSATRFELVGSTSASGATLSYTL